MLGGSLIDYERATLHWWLNVERSLPSIQFNQRPVYFVSSNTHSLVNLLSGFALGHTHELLEFIRAQEHGGLLAESQTLVARREQAGPGVARALGLTPGDAVIRWKRLRRADGIPMCVEDAYLNEVLLPGFLQTGMPTSLYDALATRGLRPTWAEDSVSADVANEQEAEHLEIEPGTAVLRQTRRALSDDKIVEVSRSVYRADRFSWRVQLGQPH